MQTKIYKNSYENFDSSWTIVDVGDVHKRFDGKPLIETVDEMCSEWILYSIDKFAIKDQAEATMILMMVA